jgi:hypothetical protein
MTTDTALPDFGEPLPEDELLEFADIDSEDIDSAIAWWDDNASVLFFGALEAGNE